MPAELARNATRHETGSMKLYMVQSKEPSDEGSNGGGGNSGGNDSGSGSGSGSDVAIANPRSVAISSVTNGMAIATRSASASMRALPYTLLDFAARRCDGGVVRLVRRRPCEVARDEQSGAHANNATRRRICVTVACARATYAIV